MTQHWEKLEDQCTDKWLKIADPDGWYHALIHENGCVEYTHILLKDPGQNIEEKSTMHVCDINRTIQRLKTLRQEARKHFGKSWE